jgi:hypothetical protein
LLESQCLFRPAGINKDDLEARLAAPQLIQYFRNGNRAVSVVRTNDSKPSVIFAAGDLPKWRNPGVKRLAVLDAIRKLANGRPATPAGIRKLTGMSRTAVDNQLFNARRYNQAVHVKGGWYLADQDGNPIKG